MLYLWPIDLLDTAGASAIAVAAGSAHTCAVLGNGGVQCWGSNENGQLGTGDTTSRTLPTSVSLGMQHIPCLVRSLVYHFDFS